MNIVFPSQGIHKTLLPLLSLCGHLDVRYAIFSIFYSQAHFKMLIKITKKPLLFGVKMMVPESTSNFWSCFSMSHIYLCLIRITIGRSSLVSN